MTLEHEHAYHENLMVQRADLIVDMAEGLARTLSNLVAHTHAVAACMGKTVTDWRTMGQDGRESLLAQHRRKRTNHTCGQDH